VHSMFNFVFIILTISFQLTLHLNILLLINDVFCMFLINIAMCQVVRGNWSK